VAARSICWGSKVLDAGKNRTTIAAEQRMSIYGRERNHKKEDEKREIARRKGHDKKHAM